MTTVKTTNSSAARPDVPTNEPHVYPSDCKMPEPAQNILTHVVSESADCTGCIHKTCNHHNA